MITTTLFALAIAATGPSDPARASTGAVATSPAAQPTKAQKPTRYCITDTVTGSRIPRTVCRTRVEWMAQGFDPIAPN